jgi:peptidyl-prolyl cis-trans isomerase D
MMDNLRAAANHVVLKIILGLIVLSFVLTGVGNYLIGGSSDYAAKVNGQEISRAQLDDAVQNQRSRLQQQLGDQFAALAGSDGYMQQLRQQSLNNLIDVTLLEQYSKKLGVTVSDQQIKDAILATPQFQTNNQFDNAKYLQTIQGMGYTADNFAQLMKQQLVSQQLAQAYGESDFVLPIETKSMSELVLQERDVHTATFNASALATANYRRSTTKTKTCLWLLKRLKLATSKWMQRPCRPRLRLPTPTFQPITISTKASLASQNAVVTA